MATSLKIDSYSIDVNELQKEIINNDKPSRHGKLNQDQTILIDEGHMTPAYLQGDMTQSPKRSKIVIVKKRKDIDDGVKTVIEENIYNSIDFMKPEHSRNLDPVTKTDEGVSLPAIGNSCRNKFK